MYIHKHAHAPKEGKGRSLDNYLGSIEVSPKSSQFDPFCYHGLSLRCWQLLYNGHTTTKLQYNDTHLHVQTVAIKILISIAFTTINVIFGFNVHTIFAVLPILGS